MKVARVKGGSRRVEEIGEEVKERNGDGASGGEAAAVGNVDLTATRDEPSTGQTSRHSTPVPVPAAPRQPPSVPDLWLQGIHDYASQPMPLPLLLSQQPTANAPNAYPPSTTTYSVPATYHQPPIPTPYAHQPYIQPAQTTYSGWSGSHHHLPVAHPPPPPPPPPAPPLREQAQRSLIILSQFEHLDQPTSRRSTKPTSILEPTPLTTILLQTSHPHFTQEESRYLTTKPSKRLNLPLAPEKTRCVIVASAEAKFRDPKTGRAYCDLRAYKTIQSILAGGCTWSGLFGAWMGPSFGGFGKAANGVPEGFAFASASPPARTGAAKVEGVV